MDLSNLNFKYYFWVGLSRLLLVEVLLIPVLINVDYFSSFYTVFMVMILVPFLFLWGRYFYKVFRIEREPVQIKTIRALNQSEELRIKGELEKYKSLNKKLIASILISILFWMIWYLIYRFEIDFGSNFLSQSFFIILLVISLGSPALFVYYVDKLDRVLALKKDIKQGLLRIEGKLFVTDMQVRNAHPGHSGQFQMMLLRMGKHTFPADIKLANSIIQGDRYAIEYYGGTKLILRIEKLTCIT